MAKWWQGLALCAGWLGLAAAADAQFAPVNGASGGEEMGAGKANASDAQGGGRAALPMMPAPAVPYQPMPFPPPPGGDEGPTNAFREKTLAELPPTRFHASLEYWKVWLSKAPVPLLVTSGSITDAIPGALGQPGTQPVLGSLSSGQFSRNGGQLAVAYDLDELKIFTVEASYFLLEAGNPSQTASSNGLFGSPVLSRPFFSTFANREDADPISVTNVMSGRIQISEPHQLQGGEVLLHAGLFDSKNYDVRGAILVGARALQLEESLQIQENLVDLPGVGAPGNTYALQERFATRNRFYGGNLGMEMEWCMGPVSFLLLGKVGLGQLAQTVDIGSTTSIRDAAGNVVAGQNTALLVGPGNAGRFGMNRWVVLPEGTAKIGYAFNEHISLSVGYMFIYVPNVVRPGNQIDRTVNVQSVPATPFAPLRPGPPNFTTSDLTVQGLTVGLQFSF